jgi:hypothetical protein
MPGAVSQPPHPVSKSVSQSVMFHSGLVNQLALLSPGQTLTMTVLMITYPCRFKAPRQPNWRGSDQHSLTLHYDPVTEGILYAITVNAVLLTAAQLHASSTALKRQSDQLTSTIEVIAPLPAMMNIGCCDHKLAWPTCHRANPALLM